MLCWILIISSCLLFPGGKFVLLCLKSLRDKTLFNSPVPRGHRNDTDPPFSPGKFLVAAVPPLQEAAWPID